jgi:hypothetical protein
MVLRLGTLPEGLALPAHPEFHHRSARRAVHSGLGPQVCSLKFAPIKCAWSACGPNSHSSHLAPHIGQGGHGLSSACMAGDWDGGFKSDVKAGFIML